MVRGTLAAILLLLVPAVPGQDPAPSTAASPTCDQPGWRMRGGFLTSRDIGLVGPAADVGFNTLLVFWPVLPFEPGGSFRDGVLRWAQACQERNLALWVVLPYFGAHETGWAEPYRRYVSGDGEQAQHTPCPLDEDYWQRAVTQRYVWLAEVSRQAPITGLALDPELYAGDKGGFFNVCYCGDCIARTLRAAGRDPSPPYPSARREWLDRLGLLQAHEEQQRQTMRALAEHTRQQVEQVAPDMLLGVFGGDGHQPLMEGLLLGLGRPDKPAWAFSEATYSPGYSPSVDAIQQRIGRSGANARLSCGVWQNQFPARVLAAEYYECAAHSAGYWIYTLESFLHPDFRPAAGEAGDYWAAIRQANQELDRLQKDPGYRSPLKIEPFLNPPMPVSAKDVGQFQLTPLVPIAESVVPAARFRQTNIFYLYATAGQRVEFPLKLIVGVPRDAGQYLLLSPAGQEVARVDLVDTAAPTQVGFLAEQTGLYALVVGAGRSAVQIEPHRPYAIAADRTSPVSFYIVIPALYVLAKPGAREITLTLGPDGEAERVRVVVTQGERACFDAVLPGKQTVTVPVDPDSAPPILKIDVQPVPGAVRERFSLAVISGAYPFVAVSPEGLLH